MTHTTQMTLAQLWLSLPQHSLNRAAVVMGIPSITKACPGQLRREDGDLVTLDRFLLGDRPACPECIRLVWLATGERELGDGL